MKVIPRIIQKWIRKQFNAKLVCDKCLNNRTTQTVRGEMLCTKCASEASERKG